ncbi:hypothetical protein G7043_09880 [Lentzea sp. NEAU-D13]|uniref:Uncharacterized protein n=1 Tax=Lentzea alba TaxID=2714351 RepID=A0A7C9RNT7_9PSEU|nr:hypothetical protein [Lentzea alba]NGY59230.1 hypothetical protein [Lentzea alba]
MNERISRRLREAAEAHQPDRVRMLARVNRGMADTTVTRPAPGIGRSWSRVALAGVAAAGVLVTAGIAFAGIVRTGPPAETTMPAVPNSVSRPSPTPPSPTGSSTPPVITRQDPPGTTNPKTEHRLSDGPLSSTGSVDPNSHTFWTQDTLVLDLTQPLTKLTVQVHIAQTGGVQSSGQWQTAPGDDFTVTVQEINGEVVYRWDLKPGRTVPAAQQVFAVQYGHTRGARDGKADRYGVMATAAGRDYAVWGGFTP